MAVVSCESANDSTKDCRRFVSGRTCPGNDTNEIRLLFRNDVDLSSTTWARKGKP